MTKAPPELSHKVKKRLMLLCIFCGVAFGAGAFALIALFFPERDSERRHWFNIVIMIAFVSGVKMPLYVLAKLNFIPKIELRNFKISDLYVDDPPK